MNIHIKELAHQIDVSVATITRFCRKIGGASSFVEFKILLRDAVKVQEVTEDVINSVHQFYESVINSTNSLSNLSIFQRACQWILEAKRIHAYGLGGSSGLSAEELKLRLSRMGLTIDTHKDSHAMIIASSFLTEEDLVIAISSSGQTKEIIDASELAKRKNAKVISISNYSETPPLANLSDLMLYTASIKPYLAQGFLNSQLSILYVLDVLSILLTNHQDTMKTYQHTLHALDEYKKI